MNQEDSVAEVRQKQRSMRAAVKAMHRINGIIEALEPADRPKVLDYLVSEWWREEKVE